MLEQIIVRFIIIINRRATICFLTLNNLFQQKKRWLSVYAYFFLNYFFNRFDRRTIIVLMLKSSIKSIFDKSDKWSLLTISTLNITIAKNEIEINFDSDFLLTIKINLINFVEVESLIIVFLEIVFVNDDNVLIVIIFLIDEIKTLTMTFLIENDLLIMDLN